MIFITAILIPLVFLVASWLLQKEAQETLCADVVHKSITIEYILVTASAVSFVGHGIVLLCGHIGVTWLIVEYFLYNMVTCIVMLKNLQIASMFYGDPDGIAAGSLLNTMYGSFYITGYLLFAVFFWLYFLFAIMIEVGTFLWDFSKDHIEMTQIRD